MPDFKKGDIVKFFTDKNFKVTYINNDGTFDIAPVDDDGNEDSMNEIEYVHGQTLKRVRDVAVGDVYRSKAYPDHRGLLVVVRVEHGTVLTFCPQDMSPYVVDRSNLEGPSYELVRQSIAR